MIILKVRKNLINAVLIKFSNLISSASVKLIVIVVFLISFVFSFWPLLNKLLFNQSSINVVKVMDNYILVLAICSILMLFIALLITRIGAQVGFEKGNKVTELILTSITRTQLYVAHIISSFMVVIISLFIIYLPLLVAFFINDSSITLTVNQLEGQAWVFIIAHTLAVSLELIILAVTVTSMVKRSEDTGPYLLLVLIPFILSHGYFSITNNIYQGKLVILNYVPLFSLIPAIGASVNGTINHTMEISMILADLVFIVFSCFWGVKVFNKNIDVQ